MSSPLRILTRTPGSRAIAALLLAIALILGGARMAYAETYEHAVESTTGLAHFWPMGEAGGATSFADSVGGANAEVLGGVTLGEPGGLIGDSSTSALFNGSTGAARASVNLSGTHELTVEFWMKWSTYGADDHLAMEFTPNFNEYNGGFLVDPDATPGSEFAVSIGRGSSVNTVFFKRPTAGEWHYYAFVINSEAPAAEEITPYVDGHAVTFTKSESGTGAGNFANSTLFWMSRDASTLFGAGNMQDLALYETTLSSSTILHHYELGAFGPKASFTDTPIAATAGVPVRLDASGSSSTAGPITDYAWDFNGSKTYGTDTGETPTTTHTFTEPGTYTVDLKVTESEGSSATTSKTIVVGAALPPYEQAVEGTTGLAHFWPMDEASGATSFADDINGANAEVLGGVTLGEPGGLIGDASTSALFNGSSGAARAGVNLSGTHELTVEFWMKWSTYGADDHLAMEFTPNFNEHDGGFLVDPDATPGSEFAVSIGRGSSVNTVFFKRPSAEEWHYYAFVINSEASAETEITPYVDGHTVTYTKSASGTGAGNFANSTLFWMSRDASTLFGAGNMQDLALYETTLSSTTILHHYELGATGPKASFTDTPIAATAGVPVNLNASGSSSTAGAITDYAWDFNGSKTYGTNSGSTPTTTHTFTAAGTYTVDLKVTESEGRSATTSKTITVAAALPPYEQAVESTTGLSHFWPMGEAGGATSFVDVFDGDSAEILGGVTRGEPGGLVADSSTSTLFNGSTGAARASVNLSATHELTVEFWMKWSTYGADDHLALEFTPNFNEYNGGFLVDPDATPGSDFAVSLGRGSSVNTVFFKRPSAGAWHYYAFVLDSEAPAEAEITPYVDGQPVSYTKSETGTGAGNFADSSLFWMSRDASTLFGAGRMQDLALYEGTLSASTIQHHYETGVGLLNTTAPSISGSHEDGQTLTANPGSWSEPDPVSYTYQWQSCNAEGGECQNLEGATVRNYTLSSADLETTLRVLLTATNSTASVQATSAATAEIEAGPPSELEAPSLAGTPAAGETLQANAGQWGGTETEIGYQWELCNATGGECAAITGATESSYTLVEGDVGKTLRIRVGVSNALGSLTAVSPVSPAIEAAATLLNTWAPSIAGTPRDGQTLTANAGSWLGMGTIGYEYQWQRCDRYGNGCENITGATALTHTLVSGDVEHALRLVVSAGETGGMVSETTPATAVIAGEGDPTIEETPVVYGTGLVGDTLTASTGTWSGEGSIGYAYQWERCSEAGGSCSSISGATASTYTLTESDVAHTLRALVTATGGSGSTTGASGPTAAISPTALLDISAPSISGPHELGRALSADPGIWTAAGAITYAYQWKRCNEHGESCSSISDATDPTYTPTGSDIGDTIEVAVTAIATPGSSGETSAPTPVIVSEPMAPVSVIAPAIEGNLTAGDTLTAEPGTWLGSATITYTYQWQKCTEEGEECANISGATADTYTLPEEDIGSTVQVVVSAGNSHGSASATSYLSEVVGAAGAPASTVAPVIDGTAKVGEQIFAGNGNWSGSRPLSYYYKWEICNTAGESCTTIEGATKPSYTVISGDVGSSLRVRVTTSNTLGSASALSAPAIVYAAGEANVERAIEIAEETDPSVIAPSTTANLEERAIKPTITDPGEELASTTTLTSSTISKETPGEFAINTPDGEFSIAPISTAPDATTTPTIVNGAAAVFAETSRATDTIIRPDALGATILMQLRSSETPTSYSWEVGIGPDQQLEELPDGSIAVTEPEIGSVLAGSPPEELLEEPKTESGEPSGEGVSGKAAEEELVSSVEAESPLEKRAAAPQVTTAAITPKSGELHPQETQNQYEKAATALEYAKAHTTNKLLMVIKKPTVVDADGDEVPATFGVEGDTFTIHILPSDSAVFPVTASIASSAPSDENGGTPPLPETHDGFSDPHPATFEDFDSNLTSGPLHVAGRARLVLDYNTSPSNLELIAWLKAVHKIHLEPYITLRECEKGQFGTLCPSHPPKIKEYRKAVERLMKAFKTENKTEEIPAVKIWGAWNEPDGSENPLHNNSTLAALFWKVAQQAADHIFHRVDRSTVVAGEFQQYYPGYIRTYRETILRNHTFWPGKPHVWGLHDYHDPLRSGEVGHYVTEDAKQFLGLGNKSLGHPHMWISEAGVELQTGHKETPLAGEEDAALGKEEKALIGQRLAANDFLQLTKVAREIHGKRPSEYTYQHIEWLYYYLYKSPTKEQRLKHTFDSALLEVEPTKPEYEDRETYCILTLGLPACPARVTTGTPVSGATTSSASTVSLTIDPKGLLTKYFVAYGTTTAYGHITSSAIAINHLGTQSETVGLSTLESCTTYHYQAEAENSTNEGTPSLGGDKTFTTGGCEPPTVMTGSATYLGENMHRLSGKINPNGETSTYYFEYGPTSAYGESTSPASAGDGTIPVEVTAEIEYEEVFDAGRFDVRPDILLCNIFHFRLVGTNAGGTSYGADKESIRCI
jgi:PKD repeat protein